MDFKFRVDQLVIIDPEIAGKRRGIVWRVLELPKGPRGVYYRLANHSQPGAEGVRVKEEHLRAAPDSASTAIVTVEPYVAPPPVGSVVKVADPSPRSKISADELFVVFKVASRVHIVGLGALLGTSAWRVPASWLTVVPLAEIAERLPAHLALTSAR